MSFVFIQPLVGVVGGALRDGPNSGCEGETWKVTKHHQILEKEKEFTELKRVLTPLGVVNGP